MKALVLAVALLSVPVFGQSPCAHSTAFHYANHRMVVPVVINGHGPYNFLLDTGTQITIIDPLLVSTLHLTGTGKVQLAGMGTAATTSFVTLDSMELDGHSVPTSKVVVYDIAKVRNSSDPSLVGILGQDFLERFNFVINSKTGCIRIFEGYNP